MTWIEVVSDAVKIGLGALIAGSFALIGSGRAHKHKLAEEYSKRRRDTLEKIATDFDEIAITGMDRAAHSGALHAISGTRGAKKATLKIKGALEESSPVLENLYGLHSVELRLALLGFPHIAEEVEKYRNIYSEIDAPECEAGEEGERYADIEEALQKQRTIVVTLMAEAYQRS